MLGKWFTLGSGFVFTPSPSSAVSFSPKLLWFQPFLFCAWTGSAAPAVCWGSRLCLWVWKSWYSKYWGPEEEAGMSLAPFGRLVNFEHPYALWATTFCLGLGTLLSMNVFEPFLHLLAWSSSRFLWQHLPSACCSLCKEVLSPLVD